MTVVETDFNRWLRGVLAAQGLEAIHIKEAHFPGVADLLIFKGQQIVAWAELKVNDEEVRPSQREFLRARDAEAGNAYVLRYMPATGNVMVFRAAAEAPMATVKLMSAWEQNFNRWNEIRMEHNKSRVG
jgi:hypothetical protein